MSATKLAAWLEDLRRLSLQKAAALAGLELRRGALTRCPSCGSERRSRSDRRPPVGTSGSSWKCWSCGATGDIVALLAHAATGELRPADWSRVREWADAQGILTGSAAPARASRRASRPEAWPPALDAVPEALRAFGRALWRSCETLEADGWEWGRRRGIGEWAKPLLRTATVATAALARVPVAGWVAVPWISPAREILAVRFRRPWEAEGGDRLSPRRPAGIEALFPRPGLLRRPGASGNGPLVVVEGESDALSALEAWPSATAWILCSATSWRSSWLHLLPAAGEVVVALDADAAGRRGQAKVLADVHRFLGEKRYLERVRVPELREGEDLSDAVRRLRKAA